MCEDQQETGYGSRTVVYPNGFSFVIKVPVEADDNCSSLIRLVFYHRLKKNVDGVSR